MGTRGTWECGQDPLNEAATGWVGLWRLEGVELCPDGLRHVRRLDGATEKIGPGLRHDEVGSAERARGEAGTVVSRAAARERRSIKMRHGETMDWEEEVALRPARTVARPVYSWDRCADHEAGDRGRSHRHRRIRAVVVRRLLAARAPRESKRAFARGWRWRRGRSSGYARSPSVTRVAGSGGRTHGGEA